MREPVRAVIKQAPREEVLVRITTSVGRPESTVEGSDARAVEVLRSAYEAARRIREEARVEIARAVVQAREEARAEGEAAWQERLRRLDRVVDELAAQGPAALASFAAPAVVRLSLEVARRVVRRAVEMDPDLLLQWVQEAAGRLHGFVELVVRVNPRDLELLGDRSRGLERPGLRVVWVPDPQVEGGCVVESEAGKVDASLQTQLGSLRERLEEVLGA
ncbi:MAG: FliH/SctL family protein [Armatimonadota bacterium]|nr:FliH/SctL family protein [Armatimonadota bacterium]MDR7444875.1 FliH/SctL family protein [Armatimonadota bacterium]MDR7569094.1 FliH/SctL family protein [Armatimonadota bacterium]MDR7613461.1 FliH/SctL family protein [Armatimonadota bacterium]